jgi:exosortase
VPQPAEPTMEVRNDLFDPSRGLDRGRSKLVEAAWYVVKCVFFLSPWPYPSRLKCWLLRMFGARIGAGVVIKPRVNILFPWKLAIGDFAWIGEEALILNFEPVTIGSHCCISQRAYLCGGSHDYSRPDFPYRNGPITLGRGAWICSQVFVAPGINIGSHAVVTAGSVVTNDQPAHKVCGGNPSIPLRERWQFKSEETAAESADLSGASAADATVSPGRAQSGRMAFAERLKWMARGPGLIVLALAACWFLLFDELWGEWQINAQYSYGYFVPLLGAVLVWRRWPGRPAASRPRNAILATVVCVGLLLLLLPLRLVIEANPEWRLAYWMHAFEVFGLTSCFLYYFGGWRWVRYFAPPIAFMFIAVPWPMQYEQAAIQGLMRFVTAMTVAVADCLGIPALQHGNLVEVGAGVVGIDEACSGVRSLQSALMLSLFLGEMYRFSILRRLSLLAGSMSLVLASNLARTTFLVWAADSHGIGQMRRWHDAAGNLVMVIILPSLMLFARLIRPREPRPIRFEAPSSFAFPAIPRWAALGVIAWTVVTLLTTEIWYRTHEANLVPNKRWVVDWPADNPDFRKAAVPETSLTILRCSDSQAGLWQDDDGNQWSGFFLRWNPGRNSAQLAHGHSPDICFPAAGAVLVDDLGRVTMEANGVNITFRHETFASGDRLLHVFYCLSSDYRAKTEDPILEDGSEASRWEAALAGKRNLGQEAVEFVIVGPNSASEAVVLLKKELPRLVHPA